LPAFHLTGAGGRLVVKTMEMEETVRYIQANLAFERVAKSPRVTSRRLDADKNLSVLKCDDISRPWKIEKMAMQFRHAPVRNKDHSQLRQTRQVAWLSPRNLKTLGEDTLRKFLQRPEWDAQSPLPVVDGDPGCRTSRVILHFGGRVSA
jgi:hypothetical protein